MVCGGFGVGGGTGWGWGEVVVGLYWMGWCGDGVEASAIIYPAPGWYEPDVRCDKTQT